MRRGAVVVLAVAAAAGVGAAASVGAGVARPGAVASDAQYEKKVTICHRTGSKKNPFRTIRVSRNAVKAHLRHGDALGPCSSAVFPVCVKTKAGRVTVKVKGAKKAQRLMRSGAKLGKCKGKGRQQGKDKGKDRGKGGDKGKGGGKPKDKPKPPKKP
jgi:hypothetical protein